MAMLGNFGGRVRMRTPQSPRTLSREEVKQTRPFATHAGGTPPAPYAAKCHPPRGHGTKHETCGAGRARTDHDQMRGSLHQSDQSLMHPHLTNRLLSTSSGLA